MGQMFDGNSIAGYAIQWNPLSKLADNLDPLEIRGKTVEEECYLHQIKREFVD